MPNDIGIISTGDPVKDAEELQKARQFYVNTEAGICANGCGPMDWETPFNAECPVCHFMLSTNLPYDKKPIETIQ